MGKPVMPEEHPDEGDRKPLDVQPMDVIAFQRTAAGWILGALALIVASFFVATLRPLFGGSGLGLAVELVSCFAGVVLAAAVAVTNIRVLRKRPQAFRRRAVIAICAVVAVAVLLDLVASFAAMAKR